MSKQNINIQDGYLFQRLKEATIIRVRLITGEELVGRLRRFDRFALILVDGEEETLIYKHAIATLAAEASSP
jgi:host factor-I protein